MSEDALAAEISTDNEPKTSGRLQQGAHPKAWRALTRDPWVRTITEEGLKVQMNPTKIRRRKGEPKPLSWDNPSPLQREWQEKVIAWNAIERVPREDESDDQIIHNLVAADTGRICSNTSTVNRAAKPMKIKMESVRALRRRITKDEWVLQLDMSKFYWTMQINPAHRKYFRFRINDELWQWRVMPFGFVNAMQIMKRLMDIIQKKLRSWGTDSTCWVDDMVLFLGTDKKTAIERAMRAIKLLKTLGFIINPDKTMTAISKSFTFRGFDWRTDDYSISIPTSRLRDIRRQAARTKDTVTPRQLACLIGKIRYAANVDHRIVAHIVELEISKKEMLGANKSWDTPHPLPQPAKEDRDFWRTMKDTRTNPLTIDWTKAEIAQGDAGPHGYGYTNGRTESVGAWTNHQEQQSTNHREIEVRSIYNKENWRSMAPLQIFQTDSSVHAAVAKRIYSKSEALSRQTAKIVIALEKHGIRQKVVRISQEEIRRSDELSRIRDDTDITLSTKAYSTLCERWKVAPTIDLFATKFSRKNARFFTKTENDTSALAVDAFAQTWNDTQVYAFPPPNLASRALHKLIRSPAIRQAIFIVIDDPNLPLFRSIARKSKMSLPIPEGELHFPYTKKRQTRRHSNFRAFFLQTRHS